VSYRLEWDVSELKARLEYLSRPELKTRVLEALAEHCAESMRQEAPEITGALKSSIIVEKMDELTYIVGPTIDYSIYVEYGTKPHLILPRYARALRFETEDGIVFAKKVYHPGSAPNPFVRRAAEDTIHNAGQIISEVISEE
jgi:HK97 gp10 family phage protein